MIEQDIPVQQLLLSLFWKFFIYNYNIYMHFNK